MNQEIIVALIGVFVAVLGGNGFWDFIKSKSGKKSSFEKMVLAIGRDRLLHLSKAHIQNGYIPEDEFEAFDEMGNAYIEMGGNSLVKRKFEEARKLNIKSD